MFYPGIVSISFRDQSPEAILTAASGCGLRCIEWGSDVHAPYRDPSRLQTLAAQQETQDISCCSYGTYFRLGQDSTEELSAYIQAAKILGTRILRLWAGRKKAEDCTEAEREQMICECRKAAALAEKEDVILCLECHRRSYTETRDGALELMQAVSSPNFRMYWQPNPDISIDENREYLAALAHYITHIHVFNWSSAERFPLKQGLETWKTYLSGLSGDHHLLLEFMPDDRIESLQEEAAALHTLIQKLK